MTGTAGGSYAGVVSRTIAYLVDAAVVTAVAFVVVASAQLIGSVIGHQAREFARALVGVYLIVLPWLFACYCMVFWTAASRTPGMALIGIRVVTTAGRPVSWLASVVRATVLAWFPIGALWCLVNRRRQAVHDKLAGTIVVYHAPARRQPSTAGGRRTGVIPG